MNDLDANKYAYVIKMNQVTYEPPTYVIFCPACRTWWLAISSRVADDDALRHNSFYHSYKTLEGDI